MNTKLKKLIVKPDEHKKPSAALKYIHTAIIDLGQDWLRVWKWINLCQGKKN